MTNKEVDLIHVYDEEYTDRLLENLPVEVILGVGEEKVPVLNKELQDTATEPPTGDNGGATQALK